MNIIKNESKGKLFYLGSKLRQKYMLICDARRYWHSDLVMSKVSPRVL